MRYRRFVRSFSGTLLIVTVGMLIVAVPRAEAAPGETTRASIATNGEQANNSSNRQSISDNGRFVVFGSDASNLVAGDTNGELDHFVRDLVMGTTERVNLSSTGTQANDISYDPQISGDGRYVMFTSEASNLVPDDDQNNTDVFVHDRATPKETTRVSVDNDGNAGNSSSFGESLSDDGRFVTFTSRASNLVAGDTNGRVDIFLHDRQTAQTSRVSVEGDGTQLNGESYSSAISGDGNHIAFLSFAATLVPGDTNERPDVFVRDLNNGEVTRVNVDSNGVQANTPERTAYPTISDDGQHVAFVSAASNLVPGDTNGVADVFVHDRAISQTSRVNVASTGAQADDSTFFAFPSISGDGRYVTFESIAPN